MKQHSDKVHQLEERISFLSALHLFRGWNRNRLLPVAYALKEVAFPRNSVLVLQGTPNPRIVFVKTGDVKVVLSRRIPLRVRPALLSKDVGMTGRRKLRSKKKDNFEVAILRAPQVVGEGALLTNSRPGASVIAMTEVDGFVFEDKVCFVSQCVSMFRGLECLP